MGIRVASLNVWALPAGLARHDAQRMSAIADALPQLAPDVLAFQEVWTEESRETLVAGARKAGLRSIWHPEATFGSGGLLMASRFPLAQVHFEPYLARGFPERLQHSDYWGGKGFVVAQVDTPDGAFVFANTHLHANYAEPGQADEYVGVRTAQLVQFAAGLRNIHLPLIAAGDFNLVEKEDGYRVLRGLSGLDDVATSLDRREATTLVGNPYRPNGRKSKRIDYLLCRSGRERRPRPTAIERIFDGPLQFGDEPGTYSDHAGLLGTFELERHRADRAAAPPDPTVVDRTRRLLADGLAQAEQRRGHQRQTAVAAGFGVAVTAAMTRQSGVSRRSFLRNSLRVACAGSGLLGLEQLWLSERGHPVEAAAFDAALTQLTNDFGSIPMHAAGSPPTP